MQGKYLIDTRDDTDLGEFGGRIRDFGGRKGRNFNIPLPNTLRESGQMGGIGYATVAQLGLAVYINNETGSHTTDVEVAQYADASFSGTPVGGATLAVLGGERGLFYVHTQLRNISNGMLYVRITKPAINQFTEGRLVFDYFPYLGA